MMFLMAEDNALKKKLQGIKVFDPKAPEGRNVQVFFRFPDEQMRPTYPFITIDLINVSESRERVHSVYFQDALDWPDESTDVWAELVTPADAEIISLRHMRFVPYDLWYRVTTYCREAQHDRQLHIRLLQSNRLPQRWGWLYVPEDHTHRNLDMVSWQQSDRVVNEGEDKQKRLFRKVYTVRVSAELSPFDLQRLYKVHNVRITINANDGSLIEELVTP